MLHRARTAPVAQLVFPLSDSVTSFLASWIKYLVACFTTEASHGTSQESKIWDRSFKVLLGTRCWKRNSRVQANKTSKKKFGDILAYWECHMNMKRTIYRSRRKMWSRSFLHSPLDEPTLLKTWSRTPSLQNSEKMCFCCLSHPVWNTMFWQP